jgi:hypothetical protein
MTIIRNTNACATHGQNHKHRCTRSILHGAELRALRTKRTEAVRDIMLHGYEGLTRDMFDLETAFNHYLDIWARIKTSKSSSLLLTKDTTRLGDESTSGSSSDFEAGVLQAWRQVINTRLELMVQLCLNSCQQARSHWHAVKAGNGQFLCQVLLPRLHCQVLLPRLHCQVLLPTLH